MRLRSHESSQSSTGMVLVVIPCLNEEQHIEHVVTKLAIEADVINLKIVVADGGSTDRTRAIAARMAETDHRIVLTDNPKCIQSAAVNHAVRRYGDGARFLIRVDAHADYPDRYCERLLKVQTSSLLKNPSP